MPEPFWRLIEDILKAIKRFLESHHPHHHHKHHSAPSAPQQRVTLTHGDSPMQTATITDVLPTTRQDGSALAVTDIASITFQKASLAGSPPVLGAPVTLATNVAVSPDGTSPAELTAAQLTFSDTSASPGDTYTSFVTDTTGHIGAASTAFTVPATLSPPSAPQQTVTLN